MGPRERTDCLSGKSGTVPKTFDLVLVGRSPWTAADALVGPPKSRVAAGPGGSGADEGVRPTNQYQRQPLREVKSILTA